MVYINTFTAGGAAAVKQTHRSRELEERIGQAIRDYRHVNPDMSDAEVSAALSLATSHHGGMRSSAPGRAIALVVGGAAAAVGAAAAMKDGVASGGGSLAWMIVIGTVAVALVLVGLLLASRR
jgi:hypothetical protein